MKYWFCATTLTLAVGCATAVVRPYVGEQQVWPTAGGSIVITSYDLPIFTSLPPSPYDVLAELRIESPFYAQPEEGQMSLLVTKAREIGAQALVFVDGATFFSTNRGGKLAEAAGGSATPALTQVSSFNPNSFKPGVAILAIRWTGEPPSGLPTKYARATPLPATPPAPTARASASASAAPEATSAPNSVPASEASPTPPAAPEQLTLPSTPPAVTNAAPGKIQFR